MARWRYCAVMLFSLSLCRLMAPLPWLVYICHTAECLRHFDKLYPHCGHVGHAHVSSVPVHLAASICSCSLECMLSMQVALRNPGLTPAQGLSKYQAYCCMFTLWLKEQDAVACNTLIPSLHIVSGRREVFFRPRHCMCS